MLALIRAAAFVAEAVGAFLLQQLLAKLKGKLRDAAASHQRTHTL